MMFGLESFSILRSLCVDANAYPERRPWDEEKLVVIRALPNTCLLIKMIVGMGTATLNNLVYTTSKCIEVSLMETSITNKLRLLWVDFKGHQRRLKLEFLYCGKGCKWHMPVSVVSTPNSKRGTPKILCILFLVTHDHLPKRSFSVVSGIDYRSDVL